MDNYQKKTKDGYIICISKGDVISNITEEEYNIISEAIRNKPTPKYGYDYKLKEDLTWEEYELPQTEDEVD